MAQALVLLREGAMGFGKIALISVGLAFASAATAAPPDHGADHGADHGREAQANAAFDAYPKESLARGEQGVVHYHVLIDTRGRATECSITESSGFSRLDLATCEMLMDRAQFTPTVTDSGRRRRSTYDGKVIWRIG
jgi:protein TonB